MKPNIKSTKMSGWNDLAQQLGIGLGGSVAGSIGSQIGYGLGELTGYNDSLANRQFEQQRKLTGLQEQTNKRLMEESYKQQFDLWQKTNYPSQVQELLKAGLNPSLLYAKGGSGGTTGSGGASVGGSSASDETTRAAINLQNQMTGMAMLKMKSEIDLLNAQKDKTNQEGKSIWIENSRKHFQDWYGKKNATNPDMQAMEYEDKTYGGHRINYESLWNEQSIANLTKTIADKGNAEAQALLSNNKAMGYWKELANATKNSDSEAQKAAAIKLAAEFTYGEYTNWKFWLKTGQEAFGTLTNAAGEFYNPIKTVKSIK